MNLLNDCNEAEVAEGAGRLETLRQATIQAMSNLLSANIDSGLMHSIGKYHHTSLEYEPFGSGDVGLILTMLAQTGP